jgi:hypothetical protein
LTLPHLNLTLSLSLSGVSGPDPDDEIPRKGNPFK